MKPVFLDRLIKFSEMLYSWQNRFFFFFFFFFFSFGEVGVGVGVWPFQEYFTYVEPISHQRWAKTGEPREKPPDHP